MTDDATRRDLSREQVEALPESDMRTLLLAGFAAMHTAVAGGFDNLAPLPLQFLELPDRDTKHAIAPMLVEGTAGGSASELLDMLASVVEDNPEAGSVFVIPIPGASLRAVGIFYRGWTAPAGRSDGGDRDPGDIPGAVPSRFVAVATMDGVALIVRWEEDGEPLARLTPLLDTEDGPQAALHTAAGREADLLRKLRRTTLALRQAYAEGVSAHEMPPEAMDHVCTHEHGEAKFGGPPSAVVRGDYPQLSQQDLEGMPSSALRDLALVVLGIEAHYERTVSWGKELCIVYRHCVDTSGQAGVSVAMLPQEDTVQQLHALAEGVRNDVDLRTQMDLSDDRYLGVSYLSEGRWFAPTSEEWKEISAAGPGAPVPEGAVEGRLVIGVTRDGGAFTVRRSRGGDPTVVLVENFEEAAVAFGGDIMAALRELSAAYTQFDSTSIIVPEPDAAISDLPVECEDPDYQLANIAYRWRSGTPREGHIYPPIPSDHPFADRPCWCEEPLSDGLPVQAYVFDSDDGSGGWKTASAVILHQRCIPHAAAVFANTLSNLAEGDDDHDD